MEPQQAISSEKAAAIRDAAKQDRQIEADMDKEMFKSVLESGHNALKAAMLINGGAAVAFLAFLGNLLAKSQGVKMGDFPKALLCFVFGVLLSAMASAATYFTQHTYRHRSEATGNRFRGVTIGLVILSYILFAAGALIAYRGFEAVK